jgi:hypothetical protein
MVGKICAEGDSVSAGFDLRSGCFCDAYFFHNGFLPFSQILLEMILSHYSKKSSIFPLPRGVYAYIIYGKDVF